MPLIPITGPLESAIGVAAIFGGPPVPRNRALMGLDSPDWAHEVERSLGLEEGRGFALKDPDTSVGNISDQQRREEPELGADVVANHLSRRPALRGQR